MVILVSSCCDVLLGFFLIIIWSFKDSETFVRIKPSSFPPLRLPHTHFILTSVFWSLLMIVEPVLTCCPPGPVALAGGGWNRRFWSSGKDRASTCWSLRPLQHRPRGRGPNTGWTKAPGPDQPPGLTPLNQTGLLRIQDPQVCVWAEGGHD